MKGLCVNCLLSLTRLSLLFDFKSNGIWRLRAHQRKIQNHFNHTKGEKKVSQFSIWDHLGVTGDPPQTSYVTSLEERERDIGLFAVSQWSIIRFWGNRGKMGKGYCFCYCFERFPVFGIVLVPLRTYQNQHFLQSYELSTSHPLSSLVLSRIHHCEFSLALRSVTVSTWVTKLEIQGRRRIAIS